MMRPSFTSQLTVMIGVSSLRASMICWHMWFLRQEVDVNQRRRADDDTDDDRDECKTLYLLAWFAEL